jgi:two-component system cell cycle response regulator CtrA
MRVLLIEDDNSTAKSIELALAREGMICDISQTGQEGVDLGMVYDYDIILLDLVLPDIDGYKVMEKLKAGKIKTPVFILSGLSEASQKIKALDMGATDYLTKPFDKGELIARIKAIVRRYKGHCESISQFGIFTINFDTRTLDTNDILVHLTNKEYAILELLAMRKGAVLTKEMFLNNLYSGIDDPSIKIINVFICKIRQKLSKASGGVDYIETVFGRGYMLKDRTKAV